MVSKVSKGALESAGNFANQSEVYENCPLLTATPIYHTTFLSYKQKMSLLSTEIAFLNFQLLLVYTESAKFLYQKVK